MHKVIPPKIFYESLESMFSRVWLEEHLTDHHLIDFFDFTTIDVK